jgi:transcriptional regulator with XRE-family HTH domain
MADIDKPDMEKTPISALGEFLRAVRERLAPEDFGLAKGSRRRAKGLRREEVASLCGISPTWYTWIEQGRTCAISVATLADLAAGLRLSAAERAYLFQLAGRADPALPAMKNAEAAPYAALVEGIHSPAYMLDRYWNAIAWNPSAAMLFRDWLGLPLAAYEPSPNLLRYVFLHPAARELIVDWEDRAWRLAAEYRADSAASRHDPAHQALVEALQAASPVFNQAWRSQKVLAREGGSRGFTPPGEGTRYFWQYTLRMAQQSEVKLVVLHPQDDLACGRFPLEAGSCGQGLKPDA